MLSALLCDAPFNLRLAITVTRVSADPVCLVPIQCACRSRSMPWPFDPHLGSLERPCRCDTPRREWA